MHHTKWLIGALLIWLSLLAWGDNLHAQTGYALRWYSVDGGGAATSAGDYQMRGVAGQMDAGKLSTGDYVLTGGVLALPASTPAQEPASLFLPKLNR